MKNLKYTLMLVILLVLQTAVAQKSETAKKDAIQIVNSEGKLVDSRTLCASRYYYFPNLEAYFDTQENIYHYQEGGIWKVAEELPIGYRGYSMYNKVNIVIKDYDDQNITQFVSIHKKKYPYITRGGMKKMTADSD